MTAELGLVAFFKDEQHIIDEWVQHYLRVGVTHFFMFDNGTRDNSLRILERYGDRVTIFPAQNLTQMQATRRGYRQARKTCEWTIVCDLDEFLYVEDGSTIPEFLKRVPKGKSVVHVRWKNFIPSGLLQPKSCIQSSVIYQHFKCNLSRDKGLYKQGKSIIHRSVPPRKLVKTDVPHHCPLIGENRIWYYPPGLALNHYRWQSYEYVLGIKERRGGGKLKNRYKNLKMRPVFTHKLVDGLPKTCEALKIQSQSLIESLERTPPPRPRTQLYKSESWRRVRKLGDVRWSTFKKGEGVHKKICRIIGRR